MGADLVGSLVPKGNPVFEGGHLAGVAMRQCREVMGLKEKFFLQYGEEIGVCARKMSEAFTAGGKLYAMGNGGSTADAIHLSVEFMHPIFEKRPAMPAMSLSTDIAIMTAIGNDQDFSFIYSQQLRLLAKKGDIAIAVSTSGKSANIQRALQAARELGMLTIGFAGKDGGRMPGLCDHCFVVPSFSIPRIQEVHQTLIHILWDLVHIVRGEEDVL